MKHQLFLQTKTQPRNHFCWAYKTLVAVFILLTGFNITSYATSISQQLQRNFKGYSIEKVPNKDEYIAVGTHYNFNAGGTTDEIGMHYMHFDGNGNVLRSRIFPNPVSADYEFRVVDVVFENNTDCWITMHARQLNLLSPTAHYDYAFLAKLSIGSGTVSTTTAIFDSRQHQHTEPFQNLYPTHSIYMNNELFICGYKQYDSDMDNHTTPTLISKGWPGHLGTYDKKGVIIKVNTTSGAPTITGEMEWNTPNSDRFDYDMPTRIIDLGDAAPGEFLIVGAGNVNGNGIQGGPFVLSERCGILIIHFDNSLNVINSNVIDMNLTKGWFSPPTGLSANGLYGIDAYKDNNNIYILTNQFWYYSSSSTSSPTGWGVLRVDNNLQANTALNSLVNFSGGQSPSNWAKQFKKDPFSNMFTVVGERAAGSPNCASFTVPPSIVNVNPFVDQMDINFDIINGITYTWHGEITAESIHGTTSTNLDYYVASPSASATCLEDVTRLNTSALFLDNEIIMVSPMGDAPATAGVIPDYLNSKFLRLDLNGNEPNCMNQTVASCEIIHLNIPEANIPVNVYPVYTYATTNITDFTPLTIFPVQNTCSPGYGGVFKPTNVEKTAPSDAIEIYPNPTSGELNISLSVPADENFSFVITDATGRVVFKNTDNQFGKTTINISLPEISSGVYFGTVTSGNQELVEKVIIQ